jgi:hypothetical protein
MERRRSGEIGTGGSSSNNGKGGEFYGRKVTFGCLYSISGLDSAHSRQAASKIGGGGTGRALSAVKRWSRHLTSTGTSLQYGKQLWLFPSSYDALRLEPRLC